MKNIHQQALQLIQNSEWDAAHRLIQDYSDPMSCHIHAHLHRIEGDLANARYWYQRAGLAIPSTPLAEELLDLIAQATEISN
jgi:hypothetical protein